MRDPHRVILAWTVSEWTFVFKYASSFQISICLHKCDLNWKLAYFGLIKLWNFINGLVPAYIMGYGNSRDFISIIIISKVYRFRLWNLGYLGLLKL